MKAWINRVFGVFLVSVLLFMGIGFLLHFQKVHIPANNPDIGNIQNSEVALPVEDPAERSVVVTSNQSRNIRLRKQDFLVTAFADQLVEIHDSSFKYPNLLSLGSDENSITFVANHLLCSIGDASKIRELSNWVESQPNWTVENIASNIFLIRWPGTSLKGFIGARDAVIARFGHEFNFEVDAVIRAFGVPNDPLFRDQSHHAAIDSEKAWDVRTDCSDVVVAVLDSGVDFTHPDLANSVFVNTSEIAGNGIDDDGNGFIDDSSGWDFYDNDNIPEDPNGHGTHIAGLIGAEGNNGIGVSGVAQSVQILSVKFLNINGEGTSSDLQRALAYLSTITPDVINASFGTYYRIQTEFQSWKTLSDAGIWISAAAGNETASADDDPSYPACFELDGIISVGAFGSFGKPAEFSNYGRTSVDLFAPGSQLLSTVPNQDYQRFSGTSQAAALVTGALSLLLAEEPGTTTLQMRDKLLTRGIYYDSLISLSVSEALLNSGNLLDQTFSGLPVISTQPTSSSKEAGQSIVLSVELTSSSRATIQWYNSMGAIPNANSTVFIKENAQPADTSLYWVEISNLSGKVISDKVSVTVSSETPEIIHLSESVKISSGIPLQLWVNATGSSPLFYQWYKDGQPIAGATDSLYKQESPTGEDIGIYYVIVSNPFGAIQSAPISVNTEPSDSLHWTPFRLNFESGFGRAGDLYYRYDHSGFLQISEDFISWTKVESSFGDSIDGGLFEYDGRYYYVSSDNVIRSTSDFQNWITVIPENLSLRTVYGCLVLNGKALLVGPSFFNLVDLDAGTMQFYPTPDGWLSPASVYDNGFEILVGEGTALRSLDGINWTALPDGTPQRIKVDSMTGTLIGRTQDTHPHYAIKIGDNPWQILSDYSYDCRLGNGRIYREFLPDIDLATGLLVETNSPDPGNLPVYIDENMMLWRSVSSTSESVKFHFFEDNSTFTHTYASPFENYTDPFLFNDTIYFKKFHDFYRLDPNGILILVADINKNFRMLGYPGGKPTFLTNYNEIFQLEDDESITWITPNIPIYQNHSIRNHGDLYYIDNASGGIWTSFNLIDWEQQTGFPGSGIYFAKDIMIGFVDSGSSSYVLYQKVIGQTGWTPIRDVGSHPLQVLSSDEGFIILSSGIVYFSEDSITWIEQFNNYSYITERNGEFYVESPDNSSQFLHSETGRSWSIVNDIPDVDPISSSQYSVTHDALALNDGKVFRFPPSLAVDPNFQSVTYPVDVPVYPSIPSPENVARINVYCDGQLLETHQSYISKIMISMEEPQTMRVHVEVLYDDGWVTCSEEVVVASVIRFTELSSGKVGQMPPFGGPSTSLYFTENAAFFSESLTGNIYRTTDANAWDLVMDGPPRPLGKLLEVTPEFLSLSYNMPENSVAGVCSTGDFSNWVDIVNPTGANGISYAMFKRLGHLYLLFTNGDLYHVESNGNTTYLRTLEINNNSDAVYLSIKVNSRNKMVYIEVDGTTYLSEDLLDTVPFSLPEGWRLSKNLTYFSSDYRYRGVLDDISGQPSDVVEMDDSGFDWVYEALPGWFVGKSDGYGWIGNEYGDFYPVGGIDITKSAFWLHGDQLMLISSYGNFQNVVANDYIPIDLSVTDTKIPNVIRVGLSLRNSGVMGVFNGASLRIGLALIVPGTGDSPLYLGEMDLDLSDLIPSLAKTYSFDFLVSGIVPLGEYQLAINLDSDDQFIEFEEDNNLIISEVFSYNPDVTIRLDTFGGGEIDSSHWSGSIKNGTTVNLNASPGNGFEFVGWYGIDSPGTQEISIVMDGSIEVEAHFIPTWIAEYYRNLSIGGNGWYYQEMGPHLYRSDSLDWMNVNQLGWMFHGASVQDVQYVWVSEQGWMAKMGDYPIYYRYEDKTWWLYSSHLSGFRVIGK